MEATRRHRSQHERVDGGGAEAEMKKMVGTRHVKLILVSDHGEHERELSGAWSP